MKRKLSLLLVSMMLVSLFISPAYAADVDTYEPPIDIDEYLYFSNCWAGLTPTGGGWYDVTGGAGSNFGSYRIDVTVTLRKNTSTGSLPWINVATWEATGAYSASAGASRYIAVPGVYHTHTEAKIYDANGNYLETVTAISNFLIKE